jgi:hypothetical protein
MDRIDELWENPKYSTNKFISDAKEVLCKFEMAYNNSWTTRYPTDEELEKLEKSGCNGPGAYDIEGKEIICHTNEYGEWLIGEIDSECLISDIEDIIWNDDNPFFELIHCDIIDMDKNNIDDLNSMYADIEKKNNEIANFNEKVFKEVQDLCNVNRDTIDKDFKSLLDFAILTDKIEIVKKPEGEDQFESCGIFTKVYVDQYSIGMSGDSFSGYIYGKFAHKKWLKIPYEC